MPNTDDYILVKDKDGNLKYYKDGRYFSIEEIEAGEKKSAPTTKPKTDDDDVVHDEHMKSANGELDRLVESTVDKIIDQLKIKFTDTKIKQRFYTILSSKLREIRSDKEVRYMLTVPKAEGGLGLDEQKADLVLTVVKKHESDLSKSKNQITSDAIAKSGSIKPAPSPVPPKLTQPKPIDPITPKIEAPKPAPAKKPAALETVIDVTDLDRLKAKFLAPKPEISQPEPPEPKLEITQALASGPKPETSPDKPSALIQPKPQPSTPPAPAPKAKYDFVDELIGKGQPELKPEDIITRRQDSGDKKPPMRKPLPPKNHQTMDSGTVKPYLMGPVEELRTLDLENFVRMGTSPRDTADNIYEKIATLKAESWRRGLEGVAAWKSSPVFKLYTQMGVDSIVHGKSIDQVIVDRQIANQESLSPDQFQAILELSQRFDA